MHSLEFKTEVDALTGDTVFFLVCPECGFKTQWYEDAQKFRHVVLGDAGTVEHSIVKVPAPDELRAIVGNDEYDEALMSGEPPLQLDLGIEGKA